MLLVSLFLLVSLLLGGTLAHHDWLHSIWDIEQLDDCTRAVRPYQSWRQVPDDVKNTLMNCIAKKKGFFEDDECARAFTLPINWTSLPDPRQKQCIHCIILYGAVNTIRQTMPSLYWVQPEVLQGDVGRFVVLNDLWCYYLVSQQYNYDRGHKNVATPPTAYAKWSRLGLSTRHYDIPVRGNFTLVDYLNWNRLPHMTGMRPDEMVTLLEYAPTRRLVMALVKISMSDFIDSVFVSYKHIDNMISE